MKIAVLPVIVQKIIRKETVIVRNYVKDVVAGIRVLVVINKIWETGGGMWGQVWGRSQMGNTKREGDWEKIE